MGNDLKSKDQAYMILVATMEIQVINITYPKDVKRINKPWGFELWLECAADLPYVMKWLHITAGQRLSLQAHAQKAETMLVLEGEGQLHTSETKVDCDRWAAGDYAPDEIKSLMDSVVELPLRKGSVLRITPGEVHRIAAATDMDILECSTNQLTDVIRIHDDSNRPSGHIPSEHA